MISPIKNTSPNPHKKYAILKVEDYLNKAERSLKIDSLDSLNLADKILKVLVSRHPKYASQVQDLRNVIQESKKLLYEGKPLALDVRQEYIDERVQKFQKLKQNLL